MKTMAFVIGLIIMPVGAVGIFAPSGLLWLAHHSISPEQLYVVAASRVAFGVLLVLVASKSRAPRALRMFALIPIASGIAVPLIGAARAPALIEWWSQQGSTLIRLTGVFLLVLGSFVAYACAPVRRTVS